jgi:hypothetical protein
VQYIYHTSCVEATHPGSHASAAVLQMMQHLRDWPDLVRLLLHCCLWHSSPGLPTPFAPARRQGVDLSWHGFGTSRLTTAQTAIVLVYVFFRGRHTLHFVEESSHDKQHKHVLRKARIAAIIRRMRNVDMCPYSMPTFSMRRCARAASPGFATTGASETHEKWHILVQ